MPRKEGTIAITNIDNETALAISYQAFKELGWSVLFAGEEMLQAQTDNGWNTNPQHVIVTISGSEIVVSSEMIKNELTDIIGKNKKNINAFTNAFESAKSSIEPGTIEANKRAINELRSATKIAIERDIKDAEEVDKAMNLSGSNLYVTYAVIAINVIIFILMIANGAGFFDPNSIVHIKWGSNYTPLTLTGDWWRLVTNVFIHFGIIHIVMNMYCLYAVGIYLEPMLGKARYIAAYLSTGVLASLVSLWWHKEGVNSAGASGAVFGLYGLFLALLTTKLIPETVRNAQLKSIGIFVVYNLVYGMKGGVDNAAHIGGLISGFVIGYLYAINIKKERKEQKATWVLPLIVIATIGSTVFFLSDNKKPDSDRKAALSHVRSADYADGERFTDKYNEMVQLQDEATKVWDENLSEELLEKKLNEVSLPLWEKAALVVAQMQKMNVSPEMQKKADAAVEYVDLRKKEIAAITDIVVNKSENAVQQLDSVRNRMKEVLELLQ
jgi:rhomboid protease GluP